MGRTLDCKVEGLLNNGTALIVILKNDFQSDEMSMNQYENAIKRLEALAVTETEKALYAAIRDAADTAALYSALQCFRAVSVTLTPSFYANFTLAYYGHQCCPAEIEEEPSISDLHTG